MPTDPVEAFYRDACAAVEFLGSGEASLQASLQASLAKALVLAAASSFEVGLLRHLEEVYRGHLTGALPLANFVRNKAIERQYHTYFDWDSRSGNRFFGLFGSDFARSLKGKIQADADLSAAMADFIMLGQLRNQIVHGDFAAFALDKTLDEVIVLYRSALRFVATLQSEIA